MSLSDFVGIAGHSQQDRASAMETVLGWLTHPAQDRTVADKPPDQGAHRHRMRETGYLRDIGI